jgi:hypothetical protein
MNTTLIIQIAVVAATVVMLLLIGTPGWVTALILGAVAAAVVGIPARRSNGSE